LLKASLVVGAPDRGGTAIPQLNAAIDNNNRKLPTPQRRSSVRSQQPLIAHNL
jgi:hypothetical protein